MNVREYLKSQDAVESMVNSLLWEDCLPETLYLLPQIGERKEHLIEEMAITADIVDGIDKEEVMQVLSSDDALFEELFNRAAEIVHAELQGEMDDVEE